MSMEVWKEIDDNQRYEVSNYGRVRSKDMVVNGRLQNCHKIKGRILKPHTDKEGYKGVVLCINQKRKTFRLHRLVAAAFIPNPDNKPCVDHIDGDRANNHADNLRWVTAKENCNNPITKSRLNKKIGGYMVGRLGGLHQRAKQIAMYSICGDLIKTFLSVKDAQRETGLNDSNIVKCCKGIKKTCGGYIWAYV